MEKNKNNSQVKSKKRVSDHGEVFTNEREVNAMLDLVKQETERIESTFLEPACGNGNFLAEVLRRKLKVVTDRYKKSQFEWERYAVIAISSIYGVDILEDNAQECRERLFNIFNEYYQKLFKQECKEECKRSVKYLLHRNVLWGDALDFTNPVTKKPIIFSEWKPINGTLIKRKDYMFQFLVEKSMQLTFFDENNSAQYFDQEIQDYKPIHFLKLGDDDTNEL
ncbi:SAM-dependent DNA methyltransferase [Cloacibacterium sp. TD35]|uniref:SAM-dependent DNA methyltransferase n=1 Tax=Cloacibacterium sp. TD35 TaxID=2976818 RepID=UPI00237D3348|nr:SAM-dependent DNA methyltransferase [Cloacibacterium sp. TD35]WDT67225.1 SAM-dependent DNA methyltransferase [Cloacibacterium sp. TD35]